MKNLLFGMKAGGGLVAALIGSGLALAQAPGGRGPVGITGAMTRLFGPNREFTAKAEVIVRDKTGREVSGMPMDFSLHGNQIRVELDQTKGTGAAKPPPAIGERLKIIGMARLITIIRPDKNLTVTIFPDQKAYLSAPLPEGEGATAKQPKITKTPLGKETLDGHPCVKYKVVITDDKGHTLEPTTWEATDMKDFPIQIQTTEDDSVSIVHFKQVQFSQPDPKLFEPPAGFTGYSDPQQLKDALDRKYQTAPPAQK